MTYHDAGLLLFLLTIYAKNERADLTQRERNSFAKLTKALVESYRKQKS